MTPKKAKGVRAKCDKLGLDHAWYDITSDIIYPTNPPQFPPQQEKCSNCGLVKTHRESVERWSEYSDGREEDYPWRKKPEYIDITGDHLNVVDGTGLLNLDAGLDATRPSKKPTPSKA